MSIYLTKHMLDPTSHKDTSHSLRGRIGHLIGASFRQWQRHRMTASLYKLDDRMLADIGLWRGDIPRLVEDLTSRELRMNPIAPSSSKK